jgi:predicted nucleotidyltransferase/plasmid stability protein
MPVSFSVKNVPDRVAKSLRARAKRNHRSLQGELLALLEAAAEVPAPGAGTAAPCEVREAAPAWGVEPASTAGIPPSPTRQPNVPAASPGVSIDRRKLAELCRRHHIRRLSMFGSALRTDFRPESDVDFLVEFDERHPVGFRIFDVEQELSALIGGRKPDIVNPKYLNARLKPGILASAKVLYAEG